MNLHKWEFCFYYCLVKKFALELNCVIFCSERKWRRFHLGKFLAPCWTWYLFLSRVSQSLDFLKKLTSINVGSQFWKKAIKQKKNQQHIYKVQLIFQMLGIYLSACSHPYFEVSSEHHMTWQKAILFFWWQACKYLKSFE